MKLHHHQNVISKHAFHLKTFKLEGQDMFLLIHMKKGYMIRKKILVYINFKLDI